jgi:1-hydroxycarotenoid 3,4-desaturase
MTSVSATIGEIPCSLRRHSHGPKEPRIAIVGAGVAGLCAAISLASKGCAVTVFERFGQPGGKIRQVEVSGRFIDAGPTVLTMLWVFERLFDEAGSVLADLIVTKRAEVLGRHAWQDGSRLDLFSDHERTVDAIASFSDRENARAFRRFAETSRRLYKSLQPSFIDASKPNAPQLAIRMLRADPASLFLVDPTSSLWQTLGRYFTDPRLRQLFGRYATYAGSSPFDASATLMLIAHVECDGMWTIEGGMSELAKALARLARSLGVEIRYGCAAAQLEITSGSICGLHLENGEFVGADAIVLNADCEALTAGLFGKTATKALRASRSGRSLSALTTALVAHTRGSMLSHHNVFFSRDYRAEFDDIFVRHRPPEDPTVYVCAQDRTANLQSSSANEDASLEKLLVLVNAPADGDCHTYQPMEIERCWERTLEVLNRCGLSFVESEPSRQTTTPSTFHALFPATGGALYGRSSHGWAAAFRRPGNRTAIPGLYLAGGSVHPGAGVPMAALSGRRAAASLLADLASIRGFHPVAIFGGTSTR